jgi:hypothetical protein
VGFKPGEFSMLPSDGHFLINISFQKVGVHVKADMTCLFHDCRFKDSDKPFTGAVELGLMAKQHNFADCVNISLVDLTTVVLHHYLSKDQHICISTAWDNCELTLEQGTYAALDVYASAAILKALEGIPVGTPVSKTTPGRTHVKLFSCDRTSTATYGTIALHHPPTFGGIHVTPTCVIVNVTSVIAPAYLIQTEVLSLNVDTPLSHFGTAFPFGLL